jgi:antitoxin component of RelBE/YafQ-DinJ toxin-antitoxin module
MPKRLDDQYETTQINLRVPINILAGFKRICFEKNISVSQAIREYMEYAAKNG